MTEQYIGWALVIGLVVGGRSLVAVGRIPRVPTRCLRTSWPRRRRWISATVDLRGGMAPADLVQEVLELHVEYVARAEDPI